jgi:hypothetical protein
MWLRKWLSDKKENAMATLLNELRTEDEKAFYNYTRLPRGLYDGVLRACHPEHHSSVEIAISSQTAQQWQSTLQL